MTFACFSPIPPFGATPIKKETMNTPQSDLFGQIDVTQTTLGGAFPLPSSASEYQARTLQLLTQISDAQNRQTRLLEILADRMTTLVNQSASAQQQKAMDLQKWQNENPLLTDECRDALEALSKVHIGFLETMAEELDQHKDEMLENEFAFADFVDKYGPRMIHLNSMLQFLSHLGAQIKVSKRPTGPGPEAK